MKVSFHTCFKYKSIHTCFPHTGQELPDLSLDLPDAAKHLQLAADLLAFEQVVSICPSTHLSPSGL
jgi:hypothetical protein